MSKLLLLFFSIVILLDNIYAKNIPRFAVIKFNKVNARTGPGKNYPIEWIYTKKFEPIEVIEEYENWRKIRDFNGDIGWVHLSTISSRKYIIVTKQVKLKKSPSSERVIAVIMPQVRCMLLKCKAKYCEIRCKGNSGWVSKELLWGV